ncbi:MAG TPA: carboxypeptidase-like regulatory domain-containing protein [Longimicrobium sp.]|nr:carboxypeptidase-like regulatory domain-containing protein [Longimicrobium sp.]
MRRITLVSLAIAVAACSEASPVVVEDHAPPDGVADVAGQVLDASGAPVAGSVTIACAGGAFGETVPIDAQGRYHAFLVAPWTVLGGGESGRVACRFSAGAIRADATVGFGPRGLPHVLQIVDLRAG